MRGCLAGLLLLMSMTGWAFEDTLNPEQFERYQGLVEELRCLVCQNQNLAESHAGLAMDLKRQVAEMVRDGKSNDEIKTYLQARYGDFVLYRPPFKPLTWVLWIAPFALLLMVLLIVFLRLKTSPQPARDAVDQDALNKLLDQDDA